MSALLSIRDLAVHFPVSSGLLKRSYGAIKAVDGVSLDLHKGETLGLVGESGCGKSTLGKALVRLYKPQRGTIEFQGTNITSMSQSALRSKRRDLQMIFQDPSESLNARHSVRMLLEEPFVIHRMGNRAERRAWVDELLERVGLPRQAAEKYAFEFSGGQRQRIGIARALALRPKLIICDEPVSALDVSVQSQVLNLLLELQRDLDLSYLFIAHDLAVVKHVSDRVAVMYLGKIVEIAPAETLYRSPRHIYSKALIAAIPSMNRRAPRHLPLPGDVPSPLHPPAGSAIGHRLQHPRYAETVGRELPLVEIAPQHWVAADPCALSDADYELAQQGLLATNDLDS